MVFMSVVFISYQKDPEQSICVSSNLAFRSGTGNFFASVCLSFGVVCLFAPTGA